MIIAFSTSSALASVAAIDRKSGAVWSGSDWAPQAASGACFRLLQAMAKDLSIRLEDAELFAADIGPGSFTGVRVGVTLAKSFGYLYSRPVAGATSFDLIANDRTVVLPSKKGEYFIRHPFQLPVRGVVLPEDPFVGFGPEIDPEVYPEACRFANITEQLVAVDAMSFVPDYLIEPSISMPKKPFLAIARTGD